MRFTVVLVALCVSTTFGVGASAARAGARVRPLPARFLAMGGAGIALARGMPESGLNPAAIALGDGLAISLTGSNLSVSRKERAVSAGAALGHLGAGVDWSRLSMEIRAYDIEGSAYEEYTWRDDATRVTLGAELMGLLRGGAAIAGAQRLELAVGATASALKHSIRPTGSGIREERDIDLDLGFIVGYAEPQAAASMRGPVGDGAQGARAERPQTPSRDHWRLSFGGRVRGLLTPDFEGSASSPARVGLGLGVEVAPVVEQTTLPRLPVFLGDPLMISVELDGSRLVGREMTDRSKETRMSSGVEVSILGVVSLRGGGTFETKRDPFWSFGAGLGGFADGTGVRLDWARTRTLPWLGRWENRFSVEASIGSALLAW